MYIFIVNTIVTFIEESIRERWGKELWGSTEVCELGPAAF